ncbi:MAG: ribosomal protein S18-alanine N-acetyltransferase [Pseudomonadota bacterium]
MIKAGAASLREASRRDLTALTALDASVSNHPWSARQYADVLGEQEGSERIVVASFAEILVGFVVTAVIGEDVSIYKVVVQPSWQRQGIGRLLMSQALMDARIRGANRCFLEVRASNYPALNLYRDMGFQVDGKRSGYYPMVSGREDAILMSLQLS